MSCLLGLDLVKHQMLWWINVLVVPAWILGQGQRNSALLPISSLLHGHYKHVKRMFIVHGTMSRQTRNSGFFVWSSFPIFCLVWSWFVVNFKYESGKIILCTTSFFTCLFTLALAPLLTSAWTYETFHESNFFVLLHPFWYSLHAFLSIL